MNTHECALKSHLNCIWIWDSWNNKFKNWAILTFQHDILQLCQTDWCHSHMPKSSAPLPPSTEKFQIKIRKMQNYCILSLWLLRNSFLLTSWKVLQKAKSCQECLTTYNLFKQHIQASGGVTLGMAMSTIHIGPPLHISTTIRCIAYLLCYVIKYNRWDGGSDVWKHEFLEALHGYGC